MIQLSYQPAFDPYHSAFRLLRLRETCWSTGPLSFDALRIADFFLLFPFLIGNSQVRLQRKHVKYRKLSKKYSASAPFGRVPAMDVLFRRMEPFQFAAAETLVNSGFASSDEWHGKCFFATEQSLPMETAKRIGSLNGDQSDLLEFLTKLVTEYEVSGPNGLKDRTSLLEFRYDSV